MRQLDDWQRKGNAQSPDFQVFTIHDDIVETEKNRIPIFDHVIVHRCGFGGPRTFGTLEHNGNDTTQHRNGQQTDFLVLAYFAEICDAHSEICESAMPNNRREMFFVESGDNLKC